MNKGYRFGFAGTDAKGTIISMSQSAITYAWDHNPKEMHVLPKQQFLDRQYPISDENTAAHRAALERLHNA